MLIKKSNLIHVFIAMFKVDKILGVLVLTKKKTFVIVENVVTICSNNEIDKEINC